MGLHTGEPWLSGENYVGMDVHRAARIANVGHGGQVLLSQTTMLLTQADRSREIKFRDLGEHCLKDLLEPQRIYQLVIPGLPSEFPPIRSLDTNRHNLPVQPTPILGREREIEECMDMLSRADVHLLTLTGPGGTGKTRLALQLAAEMVYHFPDGVYFVPLAAVTDPGLTPSAIARAVGVREMGSQSLLDQLKEHLVRKRILLILDNFEQIITAASLVTELLAACPHLKLVVTSREFLHVRGEFEYSVTTLLFPDSNDLTDVAVLADIPSISLFVQRARAARSSFELNEENASAVAGICARLDGLPLAIELAAARVKLLPPQAILARMAAADGGSSLDVLSRGPRDAPERHRALRSTIEWSYNLLDENEARLFRRLSAFAGGFTLLAAVAVSDEATGDGDLEVMDGLESLLDKSLVRGEDGSDDEPRFTMLETIAEFAAERLGESGEKEDVLERHAHHYLDLALEAEAHLESPEQARWLDRLELEIHNLRTSLEWFVGRAQAHEGLALGSALGLFWLMRGYLSEGREWLRRLLALPAARETDSLFAGVLDRASLLARYQSDYGHAAEVAERSLIVSRELGDGKGIADSLANLGFVHLSQEDYHKAAEFYEEALGINRTLENFQGTADALSHLGLITFYQGDYQTARQFDVESLSIWRDLGDQQGIAWATHRLGNALLHQGGRAEAQALFEESLRLSELIGYKWGLAFSLEGLASCAAAEGHGHRAQMLAQSAEDLRLSIGMPLSEAAMRVYQGTLEPALGDLDEGERTRLKLRVKAMSGEEVVQYALDG
jgi:predicted ATPase